MASIDLSLVDFDPELKTTTRVYADEENDKLHIVSKQDATDIIEANKAFYNSTDERARYHDMDRVASIPMNLYFDLWRQGIVQDNKRFMKWLDDPENRHFRTRPGSLSK